MSYFFSFTITPTTAPVPINTPKPNINFVKQVAIVVRSVGTSTYNALGGQDSQDRRLTAVGDQENISSIAPDGYIDISKLWIISDTSDAVIEVFGEVWTPPPAQINSWNQPQQQQKQDDVIR